MMNHSPESSLTSIVPLGRLGRFSHRTGAVTSIELLILTIAGVSAAAFVAFLPTPIQVPGHAILKAMLPIVCGVALVPHVGAGTISGSAAAITAAIFLLTGMGHLQPAATTSLLLIGPAVDLALRTMQGGGARLYARLALAGLVANLCAFAVRWGTAFLQANTLHPLNFKQMASGAFFSFAACGLIAGLASGVIFFIRPSRFESEP
jgi:hypothetical protein